MDIEILGAESLGARSLCCFVTTRQRKILIDPGVALGMYRSRLLPHPLEVAAVEDIRKRIVERWTEATDIVISHFHGDHAPLVHADVYQLSVAKVRDLNPRATVWTKSPNHFGGVERGRGPALVDALRSQIKVAEELTDGEISFSPVVAHGDPEETRITVMMNRVEESGVALVHASDIQMLNDEAVDRILAWKPDIVLAAGPPLYLAHKLSRAQLERAERNTVRLLQEVETLILDHHLLRSEEGVRWSRRLSFEAKGNIVSAAEFAGTTPSLLEANRKHLFRDQPVPKDWHRDYAAGRATTDAYRE